MAALESDVLHAERTDAYGTHPKQVDDYSKAESKEGTLASVGGFGASGVAAGLGAVLAG